MIQICIPTNLGSCEIRLCSRSFSIGDEDAEDEGGGAEDTERVTADKPPGGAGGMAKPHNLGGMPTARGKLEAADVRPAWSLLGT